MIRKLRWPLLALYLLVVGLWHPAAAPVAVIAAGAGIVITTIGGPVLLAAGLLALLRHCYTPVRAA
jgi:hypothetical protein